MLLGDLEFVGLWDIQLDPAQQGIPGLVFQHPCRVLSASTWDSSYTNITNPQKTETITA